MEREQGDFGWAVEAEGQADGSDAAVDVELHPVEAEEALDVFFAERRQDESADEGQADLASVGVAGEHEIDERETGMLDDGVGVVGLVGHEDDGRSGVGGDGEVQVGVAGGGICEAAEPEALSATLDGDIFVDEDGGAIAVECLDDHRRADGNVVVAEDGVAKGRGERTEYFGATIGGAPDGEEGKSAVGDEVSGEQSEIGVEGVDLANDALEEIWLGVLVEVDVADLGNGVAVERGREVVDGNDSANDIDLVAGEFA